MSAAQLIVTTLAAGMEGFLWSCYPVGVGMHYKSPEAPLNWETLILTWDPTSLQDPISQNSLIILGGCHQTHKATVCVYVNERERTQATLMVSCASSGGERGQWGCMISITFTD